MPLEVVSATELLAETPWLPPTVVLLLSGVIAYDLLRNMWSWNGPYEVNSAIMDMVLGLFG